MRLYLINPANPVVSLSKINDGTRLNKFRVWKPLNLLVLASLTPKDWEVEVIDENLGPVQYDRLPRPDLVGITAFTSQATRAYELGSLFRRRGVPVVMGGIHVTMEKEEALRYADSVVTGEAESVWKQVLDDAKSGALQSVYAGGLGAMEDIPPARHDLLGGKYFFGSIQTTRGCPLNCSFCSVTAFNGGKFRHRPIEDVIAELHLIRERIILFVDDNLIGTRRDHIAYTKELFRAMIREGLTKPWVGQVTINMADEDELLDLAARSGCFLVYIGFESPTVEGLIAVHKKFNIQKGRNFRASVRNIQRHGITVVGSFILGIDTDKPGIGETTARACVDYGVDMANVLMLTPLPGTKLYFEMKDEKRIKANHYPEDWQYYTLAQPVAEYKNFDWEELQAEKKRFNNMFYSYPRIFSRTFQIAYRTWDPRKVFLGLVANLSYRYNHQRDRRIFAGRAAATASAEPGLSEDRGSELRRAAGQR